MKTWYDHWIGFPCCSLNFFHLPFYLQLTYFPFLLIKSFMHLFWITFKIYLSSCLYIIKSMIKHLIRYTRVLLFPFSSASSNLQPHKINQSTMYLLLLRDMYRIRHWIHLLDYSSISLVAIYIYNYLSSFFYYHSFLSNRTTYFVIMIRLCQVTGWGQKYGDDKRQPLGSLSEATKIKKLFFFLNCSFIVCLFLKRSTLSTN